MRADDLLRRWDAASEPALPPSSARFPDGADFSIEIPSVEGPAVLAAVVRESSQRGVVVNRVSQGSGAIWCSEPSWARWPRWAPTHGLEISLFVGPREEWGIGSQAQADDGHLRTAADRGITAAPAARSKTCCAPWTAASAGSWSPTPAAERPGRDAEGRRDRTRRVEGLGHARPRQPGQPGPSGQAQGRPSTMPADMTLAPLAEMRAATDVRSTCTSKAPSAMGWGGPRHEAADLVAVACAPVRGVRLRIPEPLYPAGLHLEAEAVLIGTGRRSTGPGWRSEWMDRVGGPVRGSPAWASDRAW